jgi:hypothetical protein
MNLIVGFAWIFSSILFLCPVDTHFAFPAFIPMCNPGNWNLLAIRLHLTLSGPRNCPACRDGWEVWPKTNLVLNEFLKKAFPGMLLTCSGLRPFLFLVRYKRGFKEKEEERAEKRRLLEVVCEFHYFSILVSYRCLFACLLVCWFVFLLSFCLFFPVSIVNLTLSKCLKLGIHA